MGGNIGLWIGFSLITVLEFVELFCEFLTFGCKFFFYKTLQCYFLGQRCCFFKKRQKLCQENLIFASDKNENKKNQIDLSKKNQLKSCLKKNEDEKICFLSRTNSKSLKNQKNDFENNNNNNFVENSKNLKLRQKFYEQFFNSSCKKCNTNLGQHYC